MYMGFLKQLKKAWTSIRVNDINDRRTRYILTLWSFLLISTMIMACFVGALMVNDQSISLAFIDLIKHMMYVEGGVVSVYFGSESFYPSSARDYTALGGFVGSQPEVKVDPKKDPPIHPSDDDAQVD